MCDCETIQTGLHFEAKLPPADHVSAEELMRKVKSGGESGWIFFFFGGKVGYFGVYLKGEIINHLKQPDTAASPMAFMLNSEPLHLGYLLFFQGID